MFRKRDRDQNLKPIKRLHAWALMLWGPANSWDGPLVGTRFDPVLRQQAETARRREREVKRLDRLRRAA